MKRFLYVTTFATGMATLAAELSASRLIGTAFGASNLVWASIIGLILVYLTLGYYLGGRWADQTPTAEMMFRLLTWGAFLLGLVPFAAIPLLRWTTVGWASVNLGILAGSFVAVLLLFAVPITLLGTISPFAIRLSLDTTESSGRTAGSLYAVSTVGSFIGTFLPILVTIPLMGTRNTFLLFSLLLVAIGLIGMWQYCGRKMTIRYIWMPIALILVGIVLRDTPIKQNAGQILERESAYNYIEVDQRDDYTILRLNDGEGIHSIYSPKTLDYGGPWARFLVAPFFNPGLRIEEVNKIAILGLAAGTTARQATAVFNGVAIDGYELDPEIVQVGELYFGGKIPGLRVVQGDARLNLARSPATYDLIAIDAYRPPYIPPHMTTREFFMICREHLAKNGALAVNVGSVPGDAHLIDGLAATMQSVFPSVHVAPIPGTLNTMVYATQTITTPQDLEANLARLQLGAESPLLLQSIAETAIDLRPANTRSTSIFTDDRAPIELIVDRMVVQFALSGKMEGLGQ